MECPIFDIFSIFELGLGLIHFVEYSLTPDTPCQPSNKYVIETFFGSAYNFKYFRKIFGKIPLGYKIFSINIRMFSHIYNIVYYMQIYKLFFNSFCYVYNKHTIAHL